MISPLLDKLNKSLCKLPGVGPKSAQRMAFHLLERDRDGGQLLAQSLIEAMDKIGHCASCRIFCELEICSICENKNRDNSIICIVETPADVMAIEQSATYKGLYFVLMGNLSPIDGIGPEDLGIDLLEKRFDSNEIKEVIVATSHTVEGEATSYYISELARDRGIKSSRIAHGVPAGGELGNIDILTLSRALMARTPI